MNNTEKQTMAFNRGVKHHRHATLRMQDAGNDMYIFDAMGVVVFGTRPIPQVRVKPTSL